jgi:hypothetical protein
MGEKLGVFRYQLVNFGEKIKNRKKGAKIDKLVAENA